MPAINEDLWPELNLAATVTPLSILREQAGLLGKKTKGVLRGEVETWGDGDRISHSFNIAVPSLGDYKYTLFSVHYLPTGYPVHVDMTAKPFFPGGAPIEEPSLRRSIADEDELRDWLRHIFHSDEVKRIVENLYAQAST
jgi:hypothetical protein